MTWIDQASLPLPTPEDNVTDLQQALSVLGEEQVYSDWPVGAEGMLVPWLMKLSIVRSVRASTAAQARLDIMALGNWTDKALYCAEALFQATEPTIHVKHFESDPSLASIQIVAQNSY